MCKEGLHEDLFAGPALQILQQSCKDGCGRSNPHVARPLLKCYGHSWPISRAAGAGGIDGSRHAAASHQRQGSVRLLPGSVSVCEAQSPQPSKAYHELAYEASRPARVKAAPKSLDAPAAGGVQEGHDPQGS